MLYVHFVYSYVYMYIVQFSQITSFYPVKRILWSFSAGILNLMSVDQSLLLGHPLFSVSFSSVYNYTDDWLLKYTSEESFLSLIGHHTGHT